MSTDGQVLGPQVEQLRAAGATRLYRETASGAKRNRAQLAKLLKDVEPGDVVLVTRLDRLARSTRDPLNVLGVLAEKGAMFRSLADPWADTTPHGRPHELTPHQQREVRPRRDAGESLSSIARSSNVHCATIGRL